MKDIRILYVDTDNKLKWGLRDFYQPVSGSSALVQWVMKLLFTRVGSDKFNISAGSAVGSFIEETFSTEEIPQIRSQMIYAVKHVEEYIKKQQLLQTNLLADERLKKIEVLKILYDNITMKWKVELSIITDTNRAFFAGIE